MQRRDFLKVAGVAGGALLAGDVLFTREVLAQGKKTLQVAVSSDAWRLDVRNCTDVTGLNICKQLYNGLMNYDADGNMFADLAVAAPEQPDDKTYIFKLRQGVQFHGGFGELTAEDVVFSYDTIRGVGGEKGTFLALWLRPLDKAEALDKYTVKFTMKEPYGDFLDSTTLCKVVSKKAALERGKDFTRQPIGSGPFEFVEWVKDDHITLKRFEGYFDKSRPKLDGIYVQIIPDDTVKVTNLITGQVHMLKEIPPRNLAQLKKTPGIVVGQRTGTQCEQMYFNCSKEPFSDVNLRRAVAYAIDRNSIADKVFFGMAKPGRAMVTEAQMPLKKYEAGMVDVSLDVEKSKKFLKQSSKPDGFEFTCMTTGQGWFVEQLTVIQANLAKVGIKMNIEPMEKSVLFANQRKGEYEAIYEDLNAAYFGYGAATPALFYTPPERFLFWKDKKGYEADDILKKFVTTLDVNKKQALFAQFINVVNDQVPYTQVVFVDSTDAWQESVKNYKTSLPNDSMWWDTEIS
jgi:peptide/nickel transport system substrate-binding protein